MPKRTKITEIAQALFEEAKGKDHGAIDTLTENTVKLLIKKQSWKDASVLINELERLENESAKIIIAEVESKGTLGEDEKKEIEHFIHQKFPSHQVRLTHKANDTILGGVKIKIADTVWDLTLNRTLTNLKKSLTA